MKTKKTVKPGSLERRVRQLLRQVKERDELLDRWHYERQKLAKLAAETPQFYNPLVVMEAKQIRDRILKLPNSVFGHTTTDTKNPNEMD